MNNCHKLTFVFIILASAALWQFGLAGWIHTKAYAAQILLDRAWQKTLIDHTHNRPWPLSLIHISEPTRLDLASRMPSSA